MGADRVRPRGGLLRSTPSLVGADPVREPFGHGRRDWGLTVFGHGVASYGSPMVCRSGPRPRTAWARAVRWGLTVFGHGVASYEVCPFRRSGPRSRTVRALAARWGLTVFGHGVASYEARPPS